MAGFAALLLKPALDAALAGTAAKGTTDMNKEDEKTKLLGDTLTDPIASKDKKEPKEAKKEDKPRYLSKSQMDDLEILLVEGGLSGPQARKIMKTGVISEDLLKKINPEVLPRIEKITGRTLAFPKGEKPEGTPPVTGTTVKTQTRTETPDGEVKETTTTFDGNSGVKKTNQTIIPEEDLSDLISSIHAMTIDDINPNNPRIREYSEKHGISVDNLVKLAQAHYRTHKSMEQTTVGRKELSREAGKDKFGKNITVPENKVQGLSNFERARAINRHFDEGQAQADKARAEIERLKREQAAKDRETLPDFK